MFASKDALFTAPSGYNISRSVRLRSSASAYFNRAEQSGNRQKWTLSFWIKRGSLSDCMLYATGGTAVGQTYAQFYFTSATFNYIDGTAGTGNNIWLATTQVFRDPSAWYHIIIATDTTQATASNRVKLYVNGSQVTALGTATYPSQNYNTRISDTTAPNTSTISFSGGSYDGYITEFNAIDGQALTPSSFGSTNAVTGVWQPAKYTGTYGTNGFYLNFSDNSNNTATTIGKDYSGNGNNWTPNNISVTSGATYDSMLDVPTPYADGVNGRGNYAVLNAVNKGASGTGPADGNLSWGAGGHATILSTIGASSGKWYAEFTLTTSSAGGFGITSNPQAENAYSAIAGKWWIYDNTGSFNITSQTTTTYSGASRFAVNQVWQVALDIDNGKCFIGLANSWVDSAGGSTGNPSTGANPTFTFTAGTQMFYFLEVAGCIWAANFGQRAFTNTAPSGYVALNTYNLPASTISNGATVMAATTYTGTGSSLAITNTVSSTSFKPDLVWIKSRSAATDNTVYDSVRGAQSRLETNNRSEEHTSELQSH